MLLVDFTVHFIKDNIICIDLSLILIFILILLPIISIFIFILVLLGSERSFCITNLLLCLCDFIYFLLFNLNTYSLPHHSILYPIIINFYLLSFIYPSIPLGEHPFKAFAPGLFQDLRMNEGKLSISSTSNIFRIIIKLMKIRVQMKNNVNYLLLLKFRRNESQTVFKFNFLFFIL